MLRRKPANRIRAAAPRFVPTATDLAADRAARRTPTDHRDRLGHERLGADLTHRPAGSAAAFRSCCSA